MSELEMMRRAAMAYEEKLVQLMGMDAFGEFVVELYRKLFKEKAEWFPEGSLKRFLLDNLEDLTE